MKSNNENNTEGLLEKAKEKLDDLVYEQEAQELLTEYDE